MQFRSAVALGLALSLAAAAGQARAQAAKPLRLIGVAPDASDPAPKAFVVDALVKPGGGSQTTIDGWFAATAEPPASGEVSGTCTGKHCALTVDLDDAKLDLTGDVLGAAGPVAVHFAFKDDDGKITSQGAATLRPLNGAVADLGVLAAADAVDEPELNDLLAWNHEAIGAGSPPRAGDPPSSYQHETLAGWQQSKGRLATGLIFVADLAELKADAEAARKAAGWTVLGEAAHGWGAGYPAALLPKASREGAEQRFSSADGKVSMVVAIDPPMSREAFDDFVDKVTADRDGRTGVGTVRVNGDLEMRYEEAGKVTAAAYHNRDGGLARVILVYPKDRAETFEPFETIIQRGLTVSDDLKR